VEFVEKSRYCGGDFGGAKHSDLDAGGREVGAEVVEGAAEEGGVDGLDFGDAEGGLNRKSGEDAGSEEAVGGEGLEIGGNAGSAGGIVTCDGEEGADAGGWTRGKSGHGGQPSDEKTLSYLKGNCNLKKAITTFDLFDLDHQGRDNIRMRNPMMNGMEALQGKKSRKLSRAGVLVVTLGLTASLAASPTVKPETAAVPGNPPSSKTIAKRHWFQIGKASWYGGKFNGRKTADGETYDMYAMTCAHRTLPLGSWVRITNLRNKKSTVLRVNDRGPVPLNRIVDLSYAAARRLGMDGLANVRVEEVNPSDPELAEQMVAQLRMADPVRVHPADELPNVGVLTPGLPIDADR
jgi:rare lipoprotein A